jgi:IMP dehydrogenase
MRECLAFDDVLLKPVYSEGRSRRDPRISTATNIGGIEIEIPMISSPMDTVTEERMALELGKAGGMGVIHRFMSVREQASVVDSLYAAREELGIRFPIVPAIGVGEGGKQWAQYLVNECGDKIDMISVDIANGHSVLMKEMVEYLREELDWYKPIMAGNVATGEGFSYLADIGVDAVRVGIGGGSICKTRIQTGFGIPTFASVLDCAEAREVGGHQFVSIIADGGIRYPQDLVKSIVAGADAVICGGVFAGTQEAPGDVVVDNQGKAWKNYRGMASEEVQIEKRGGLKPGTCAEGTATLTPYKGSLERVLNDFVGGLRSAFTYANAMNIKELRQNSEFIRITSSGQVESHSYGTRK